MIDSARRHALADGFAEPENRIVVVAGIPFGRRGSTNNIRVMRV
jgi:pyruvate kinase